jgi:hypothetical protein
MVKIVDELIREVNPNPAGGGIAGAGVMERTVREMKMHGFGRYEVHSYSLRVARTDFEISLGNFDTLIFRVVPHTISIRLAERMNSPIEISAPIQIWNGEFPLWRIFLSHPAHDIDAKLVFIAGRGLWMSQVAVKPDLVDVITRIIPIPGVVPSWTSAGVLVVDFREVVFNCFSDVAGTLSVQFSNDAINWDVVLSFPIDAGIGRGEVVPIRGRFVRFIFTRLVPTIPHTIFRFSSFARS